MTTLSPSWEHFPDSAAPELGRLISSVPPDELQQWELTWSRLHLLCVAPSGDYVWDSASLTVEGAREILLKHLSRSTKGSSTPVSTLQGEIERAKAILETIVGRPIPGIVICQFPKPRQTIGEMVGTDMEAASRIDALLEIFLDKARGGKERAPLDPVEVMGLIALLLVMDNGVLNRYELASALEALTESKSVRVCHNSYYVWLPAIRGPKHDGVGARRLYLTPRTAAAAMALKANGSEFPRPDEAIKRFCAKMGMRSAEIPSLASLMRGVATRLRLTPRVPQFVVDYAEGRVVSYAVPESVWRRLTGLAPWVEQAPLDRPSREPESQEGDGATGTDLRREDRGYLTSSRSILRAVKESAAAIEQLRALCESRPPVSEIDQLLLEWTIHLLGEKLTTGVPRRLSSVRTMLNALGPRLMAALLETPIRGLADDDWHLAQEQLLDPELSSSWNATIRKSYSHFVSWAYRSGKIDQLPPSIQGQQLEGVVNANLIAPLEFKSLLEMLSDEASTESVSDREYQGVIARFGFAYSMRRGEVGGQRRGEINLDTGSTIDVVHNSHRALKTDSSQRRIPIALNDHWGMDDDIRSHIMEGDPSEVLVHGYGATVSEDTLQRRLSKKLTEVTGDEGVSIQTLRHSAASWLLVTLYADDLKLDRFSDDWPFLRELIPHCAQANGVLMGKRGSMHRLHAVRGLLGHRHEGMTLLHYLHAQDWLRHAAVTLGREAEISGVQAVCIAAGGARPRDASLRAVMLSVERQYPSRIARNDNPRNPEPRAGEGSRHSKALATPRDWMILCKRISSGAVEVPAVTLELHTKIVDLINEKKAISRSKLGPHGISCLADIAPESDDERALCKAMHLWSSRVGARNKKIPAFAQLLLEAFETQGGGQLVLSVDKASRVLSLMDSLSSVAGLKFELSIERRVRVSKTNARRVVIKVSSVAEARALGAKRIFVRPRYGNEEAGGNRLPLEAFVWTLAMLVLYPTVLGATPVPGCAESG